MNHHTTTSIPIDDGYVSLVGKAMYAFSYYEWTIIYLIQHLQPSNEFVSKYCRDQKNYTSGCVLTCFRKAHENAEVTLNCKQKINMKKCASDFKELIELRNALAHAHPITDVNGEQILSYQAHKDKPIPDMKWTSNKVNSFIENIDKKNALASICHSALRTSE